MTPEQIKAEIERVRSMELLPWGLSYAESVTRRINEIELQVMCIRQRMNEEPDAPTDADHRQAMTDALSDIEDAVRRMRVSIKEHKTHGKG